MVVSTDRQEVVAVGSKQPIERCGDLAEMPLGELVGLVAHAVLGEPVPAGVRGIAQRAALDASGVS